MGKLDQLLTEVQQEIRDKKAELQAAQSQLDALQSAHFDLSGEVDKAHIKLADVRAQLDRSEAELGKRRVEADNVASNILNSAHRSRAQAEKLIEEAEARAKSIVDAALKHARDMEAEAVARKAELQTTIHQLNAAQSELTALKKSAVDWGQH